MRFAISCWDSIFRTAPYSARASSTRSPATHFSASLRCSATRYARSSFSIAAGVGSAKARVARKSGARNLIGRSLERQDVLLPFRLERFRRPPERLFEGVLLRLAGRDGAKVPEERF